MKLIYICAPLRGDVENNIKKAREYSKKVIAAGLKLVEICNEVWQFGEISEDFV